MKREKGHCRLCNLRKGEENLSNQKLCYNCAKANMLMAFDWMWEAKHGKRK